MELTFKLIALSYYLDSDATWENRHGEEWSIERLVRDEIASPIRGAACGGTHRLMGLSYCYIMRQIRGEPIEGEYLRAQTYIHDYHKYALGLQNSDGSFSTQWFVRREARSDLERRLQTTGHILEWLVFSLPIEMLDDPRTVKAVNYLSSLLINYRNRDWEIGHLGHGLHALAIYDERRFKMPTEQIARQTTEAPRAGAESPEKGAQGIAPVDISAPSEPATSGAIITDGSYGAGLASDAAGDDPPDDTSAQEPALVNPAPITIRFEGSDE
jgi:hypothetical protein